MLFKYDILRIFFFFNSSLISGFLFNEQMARTSYSENDRSTRGDLTYTFLERATELLSYREVRGSVKRQRIMGSATSSIWVLIPRHYGVRAVSDNLQYHVLN